jgi:DeoR family transcriptional regulator, suf operon transcriptional repressor
MQETRRFILDILRQEGQATVDRIVESLRSKYNREITAVTVRHHLNVLQQEGMITEPELRHRTTPGRPQHVYTLTDKALQIFPNNYQNLITTLIQQLQTQIPSQNINVIFEGVAEQMAYNIDLSTFDSEVRLNMVVDYLTQLGYDAYWEQGEEGVILHTRNCPYHAVAQHSDTLCSMDLRLISILVGSIPRRMARISNGDSTCAYLLPVK